MATRGTIAIEYPDGTIAMVYSHWDNYLEHNGRILYNHYQSVEKIGQLIENGSISSLGPEIGEPHDFDEHFKDDDPRKRWTRFYGRDRGEDDCDAAFFRNFDEYVKDAQMEEYNYLYRAGRWCVQNKYISKGQFVDLNLAFELKALEEG